MKSYKKITFAILLLIILLLLAFIVQSAASPEQAAYGNTCSNYQNAGWTAQYQGYTYYVVIDNNSHNALLKRIDSGGKCELILTDRDIHGIGNLNIMKDTLYFNNAGNSLYKFELKTNQLSKIGSAEEGFARAIIVGDWIYYCNNNKVESRNATYGELWRMKLDGTKKELLEKNISFMHWIENGWVYYQVHEDKRQNIKAGYYKMKMDGSSKTNMKFERWNRPGFDDNWIYYQDDMEKCLYKVKSDGSNKTRIMASELFSINVTKGWIYYSDKNKDFKLYKMRANGKDKTLICNDRTSFVQVHGDWIYYIGLDSNRYRIKTDGTQKTILN